MSATHRPFRNKLPDERAGIIHKFSIAGHEGYIHVGLYPAGNPGEIFLTMNKQGSTIGGLCDCIALLTSLCLQYNVPLEVLCDKMKHMRFEPAGITSNPAIREARSIPDYVFKWLGMRFLVREDASSQDLPDFTNGKPLAENDPEPLPWTETESAPKVPAEQVVVRHNEKIGLIAPHEPPPSEPPPSEPPPRTLAEELDAGFLGDRLACLDPDKMNGAGDGFGGSDEGSHYMSQTSAADLRAARLREDVPTGDLNPVLDQALEVGSGLTTAEDPTKPHDEEKNDARE